MTPPILRRLTLETADARWSIEIFRRGDEFVAKYVGIAPKSATDFSGTGRLRLLSEVGQGECVASDVESAMAACRAAINQLAGEIVSERIG